MSAQRSKTAKRLVPLIAVVVVACVAVVVIVVLLRRSSSAYDPPPLAFDGPSGDLKQTVIVPTLDTPMPEGKNVIWCASFQLAWNEFRDDVISEPVKITGAQEIADRLNASRITKNVLEPDDYYAKAGYVKDGAVEQIREDMTAQFPDVTLPDFAVEDPNLVAVAYAYLQVTVEFSQMFYENRERFLFEGVRVSSFGLRERDDDPLDPARAQVLVLYSTLTGWHKPSPDDEFIIDLCTGTQPYEVIIARIKPKGTLAETVADLERKVAEGSPDSSPDLSAQDVLLVPNLHWRVEHHFEEIEGEDKPLQNEGHEHNWVGLAWQVMEFKLDRAGATLKSEVRIEETANGGGPRRFVFDRSFLILMRKREKLKHPSDYTTEPFFVMWVDNAELLCKR